MQLIDGRPVFAATDLVGFLACGHRLALERAAMHGLVTKPVRNDPSIELIAKRGLQHEARYLADLRAEGRSKKGVRRTTGPFLLQAARRSINPGVRALRPRIRCDPSIDSGLLGWS